MKASLARATPASAPRARAQEGWPASTPAERRIAVSRPAIAVQSPSSRTIVRVSESGGSGSASTFNSEMVVLSALPCMARPSAGLVVSFDNACDEIATHHIGGREADCLDAPDAGQQADRVHQARLLSRRQIDLARI